MDRVKSSILDIDFTRPNVDGDIDFIKYLLIPNHKVRKEGGIKTWAESLAYTILVQMDQEHCLCILFVSVTYWHVFVLSFFIIQNMESHQKGVNLI